jgi:hypothetical protein
MMITQLPPEILEHIFKSTERKDWLALSATSRYIEKVVARILYRHVYITQASYHTISKQKVKNYCRLAQFLLGKDGNRTEEIAESQEPVEARFLEADDSLDCGRESVFEILFHMPKVEEVRVEGGYGLNVGRYARPSHGFQHLRVLRLQSASAIPQLELSRCTPLLQDSNISELHAFYVIPKLGGGVPPRSLPISSIILTTDWFPPTHAKELIQSCQALRKFEYSSEGRVETENENVYPRQLLSILDCHRTTLRRLDVSFAAFNKQAVLQSEDGPSTIGSYLSTFSELQAVRIDYDALLGSDSFAQASQADLSQAFLPPSLRTMAIGLVPNTASAELVTLLVGHMRRHGILKVGIDWLCDDDDPDLLNSDFRRSLDSANSDGFRIEEGYGGDLDFDDFS